MRCNARLAFVLWGSLGEEPTASCALEPERPVPGWSGTSRPLHMPDDDQLQDQRPTGVLKWQKQTIWKASGTWAASMVVRRACRSLRTEAQRSRASFATRGGRNSQRTKRALNTSAGKIGATIRLAIRNSDSPFRRRDPASPTSLSSRNSCSWRLYRSTSWLTQGVPEILDLARIGVQWVSLGPWPMMAAMRVIGRAAAAVAASKQYGTFLQPNA